jgi:membrane protein YqaA with SNARE-associated domain
MFSKIAQWIAQLADHPHAKTILFVIAFLESWIFPIPPDLLLLPMVLRHPKHVWKLASGCSIASVLGGVVGYIIGYYFYNSLGHSILESYGLQENFSKWREDFHKWGVWIILLKGFVPIPYKVVTLLAGLTHFNFLWFLSASVVVRSIRFFGLSFLGYRYGPQIRPLLDRYLLWISLATLGIVMGGYFLTRCF